MIQHIETSTCKAIRIIGILFLFILVWPLLPAWDAKSEANSLQEKKPMVSRLNKRDQIAVEFYGELIGPDDQPAEHMVVDQIIIRDLKTGKSQPFIPEDAVTLKDSFGYFKEVWSPDWEYLALPLGRFHGFAFFSSKTVMEELKNGKLSETIRIDLAHKNAPRLWHGFSGWQSPHLFKFSAGLSGDRIGFEFNIDSKVVHSPSVDAGSFKAVTKSRVLKIKNR